MKFSSIAIDHAHEKKNTFVKGDGGVTGLAENSAHPLRWMVAGPEIARLLNDFQSDIDIIKQRKENIENKKHHEQIVSTL